MKLLQSIIIKEVVTAEKKEEMINEFELEIKQCERELEQLTFQLYKATKDVPNKNEQHQLRARYTEEINKRKEKLQTFRFKVQQLHKLELGTEIRSGSAERIIEVEVGDSWPNLTEQAEIIIQNGIIHEIREGRNGHD